MGLLRRLADRGGRDDGRGDEDRGPDGTTLPTVAAITMVRDEGPMLRRWVEHYTALCGSPEALVVIDDNSEDGSTDDLPCPVLRIPPLGERPFEPARMGLLSGLAASLLHAYDAVLFTDADEFVVADPARHRSVRHLLAERPDEALGVVGLNLVHDVAREGPLDLDRPLLEQRRLAKFLPLMCKPSLKRVPSAWGHASHGLMSPYRIEPDLWMLHLKFADRDHLAKQAAHRRAMVEMDGRAATTSWRLGADEMTALLDRVNEQVAAGPPADEVPDFRPPRRRLERVVKQQPNGLWKATGPGQVQAMDSQPLVRIPERFVGTC